MVRPETEDEITLQALDQLAVSCPQLRHIDIHSFPEGSVGILSCFDALEEIHCREDYRRSVDLAAIARLPMLYHLSIPLGEDLSGITIVGDRSTTFATLETLELHEVEHVQSLAFVLQSISSTRLRNLSVELMRCSGDEEIEIADQTLSALARFSELRSLRFGEHNSKFSKFPPEPILELHDLEKLVLVLRLSLTRQGVIDLAQSCPKLRPLSVSGIYLRSVEGPHFWSLYALEWFVTHLPMLEYLKTDVDTSTVPALETPQSLVPISLVFGRSPLHEAHWRQVAAYISRVYPNAKLELGFGDNIIDEHLMSDEMCWRYVARAVAEAYADSS